jgi:hypothetical protein
MGRPMMAALSWTLLTLCACDATDNNNDDDRRTTISIDNVRAAAPSMPESAPAPPVSPDASAVGLPPISRSGRAPEGNGGRSENEGGTPVTDAAVLPTVPDSSVGSFPTPAESGFGMPMNPGLPFGQDGGLAVPVGDGVLVIPVSGAAAGAGTIGTMLASPDVPGAAPAVTIP